MVGNEVTVVGNATRDPELRFIPSGKGVANFAIANNRKWGEDQEHTSFLDVVAWDTLAENVAESITKGMRVVIVGRLEQRTWEDDEGNKRSKVEIVADEVSPSLRWASASVSRNEKSDGGNKSSSARKSKKQDEYDEEPF